LAKEAEGFSIVGAGRTYSNRESEKNEYGCYKPKSIDRVLAKA